MRISDCSSDVCSSDLRTGPGRLSCVWYRMTTSERAYPRFTPESGTEGYGRAKHPSALLVCLSARRPAPVVLEAAPRHHRVVQEHAAWRGPAGAFLAGSAATQPQALSAPDPA